MDSTVVGPQKYFLTRLGARFLNHTTITCVIVPKFVLRVDKKYCYINDIFDYF